MASASLSPNVMAKDAFPTQPPRSLLLGLPLELRFRISHHLIQDRFIVLWKCPRSTRPWCHPNTSPILALSLTSKQLHVEVSTWLKTARSVHSVNFAGHFDPHTTVFTFDWRNMMHAPSYDPFFHAGPFFNAWWNTVFQEHARHVFIDFEFCLEQNMDVRGVLAPLRDLRGLKRIDVGVRGPLSNPMRFWLLREVCRALGGFSFFRGECRMCDQRAPVVRWRDMERGEEGWWRVLPRLNQAQWLCVFSGLAAGVTREGIEELNKVRDAFTYDGMDVEPYFEELAEGKGVRVRMVARGESNEWNDEGKNSTYGDYEEEYEEEYEHHLLVPGDEGWVDACLLNDFATQFIVHTGVGIGWEVDEEDQEDGYEGEEGGIGSYAHVEETPIPSLAPLPDEGYGSELEQVEDAKNEDQYVLDADQKEEDYSRIENEPIGPIYPFGWRLVSLPNQGLELR